MKTTHDYDLPCQRVGRAYTFRHTILLLGLFLCITTLSTTLYAQVPQLINFQAQLAGDGTLPSPTTIVFSIHDAASGGTQLWTEQHSVTHTDGIFNVLLGSVTSFPATLFTDDGERYLDMLVGGELLDERFQLSSVAYALRAEAADKTGPTGITFPDGTVQVTAATSSGGGSLTLPFSGAASTAGAALSASNNGSGDALSVPSAGGDGLHVTSAGGSGVYVQHTGNDGVYIAQVGDPPVLAAPDSKNNGVEVSGAEGDGLNIGFAGGDGVRVNSVGGNGVHVEAAGGLAGYFDGDVEATGTLEAGTLESTTGGVQFPDGTVQTTAASGDDDWTIDGGDLYSSVSGNVGIGTTSPDQKLTVAGTVESTTGGFKFPDGTVQATAATGGGGDSDWTISGDDLFSSVSGNVGIGTSSPIGKVHISGAATFGIPVVNVEATAGTWDYIRLKKEGDSALEYFLGRAPSTQLGGRSLVIHVPSVGVGYGGVGDQPKISFVSSGADELGFAEAETGNWYMKGNVGIGTSTPSTKLQVLGDVSLRATDRLIFGVNSGIGEWIQNGVDGDLGLNYGLAFFASSQERMRIDAPSGFVGIGTTDPVHPLHMGSGAHVTTGGVWTNASSRDYKENIHSLTTEEAMAALSGLVPVQYNYKVDQEEVYLGFIAEDVPDLVATGDRKGLSPMDIVAVLTKVVQQQQQQIAALEARLNR